MTLAYVDSSCLVAIALDEPGSRKLAGTLSGFDRLLSSSFLEAEFLAAMAREGVADGAHLLSWLTWVFPDRPLGAEIARVLGAGLLRGSDLWHLATALYVAERPEELRFFTLDARQRAAAAALGFPTA